MIPEPLLLGSLHTLLRALYTASRKVESYPWTNNPQDDQTVRRPPFYWFLGFIAMLTACGSDDPESLTVYSGRSEKLVGPIFEAFTADTGIALEVRYGSSNDLALLLAEEGTKTPADVFLSRSPGPAGYLDDLGMLAELDDNVLDRVATSDRSPAGTWVGFAGRGRVLVYNVDEVATEDLPGSVFDLTGPEYAGRVAVPGSNSSFQDWFTLFRLRNGDNVATGWLNDMVANGSRCLLYTSPSPRDQRGSRMPSSA